MQYDINTIDELIAVLGGDTAVARWLGISQPAVALWKVRGLPGGWHLRIYAEVTRRGLTINPAVFGLSQDDFSPLSETAAAVRAIAASAAAAAAPAS